MWKLIIRTDKANIEYPFRTYRDAHNMFTAFSRQIGNRGTVELVKVGWFAWMR